VKFLFQFLIKYLPTKYKVKIAYRLLRSCSGEYRALSDLFVPPFCQWVPWYSALDEGMHALFGICRAMKPETVVEIGSARGYSTCALALACQQNGRGKVYAIDPHDSNPYTACGPDKAPENYEFLLSRLKDYELTPDWCEVIRSTSSEVSRVWNKPIDLLFIDGDHSYECVKSDFEAFRPWLRELSLVAFHDSMWKFCRRSQGIPLRLPELDVARFLDELRAEGYQSVSLNVGPGLTLLCPVAGGIQLFPPLYELEATNSHP
jgi:predicted O-methyltransferase YrrM